MFDTSSASKGVKFALLEGQLLAGEIDCAAFVGQAGDLGFPAAAVGDGKRPTLTGIGGLSDDCLGVVILQPGGINRTVVGGVDHNLGIELAGGVGANLAGRLPGEAVIVADHQGHGRQSAIGAARHLPVLRIENVDVRVAVGGDGRLPLIAFGEANSRLRDECRTGSQRSRRGQQRKRHRKQKRQAATKRLQAVGKWRH